jgi:hypothetical protein
MVFWWFFRGEFVVFSWSGDALFRSENIPTFENIFLIVNDADPVRRDWEVA